MNALWTGILVYLFPLCGFCEVELKRVVLVCDKDKELVKNRDDNSDVYVEKKSVLTRKDFVASSVICLKNQDFIVAITISDDGFKSLAGSLKNGKNRPVSMAFVQQGEVVKQIKVFSISGNQMAVSGFKDRDQAERFSEMLLKK